MARTSSQPAQDPGAGDEDVTATGGAAAVAPTESSRTATEGSGEHVLYQGRATHRRISGDQWQTAGVEGQSTVEFNPLNRHRLPTTDFTGPALEALRNDGSFYVPGR